MLADRNTVFHDALGHVENLLFVQTKAEWLVRAVNQHSHIGANVRPELLKKDYGFLACQWSHFKKKKRSVDFLKFRISNRTTAAQVNGS